MTFKDKTYCASPNCKNECGRKMTEEEKKIVESKDLDVSYAYFFEGDFITQDCYAEVIENMTHFCALDPIEIEEDE